VSAMPMMRTPIYTKQPATPADTAPGASDAAARDTERDDYTTKLIKYVPGEVVAAFGALMALAANVSEDPATKHTVVIIVFVAFAVFVTPIYFWLRSRSLASSNRPKLYFYFLSPLAFAIWAIAISDILRGAFHLNAGVSEFALAVGAFLIPLLDELLTTLQDAKPWEQLFRRTT
jgi:hypothetical protein